MWTNCYAEHKVTGKTYNKKKRRTLFLTSCSFLCWSTSARYGSHFTGNLGKLARLKLPCGRQAKSSADFKVSILFDSFVPQMSVVQGEVL